MTEQAINYGGAAFPCEGGDMSGLIADPGMSLRDYFAAKAMQAMCSMVDGDGHPYTPAFEDGDMRPATAQDEPPAMGFFYRSGQGTWMRLRHSPGDESPYDSTPHVAITTYEYRLAREAYRQADAMLAQRDVIDPSYTVNADAQADEPETVPLNNPALELARRLRNIARAVEGLAELPQREDGEGARAEAVFYLGHGKLTTGQQAQWIDRLTSMGGKHVSHDNSHWMEVPTGSGAIIVHVDAEAFSEQA